MKTAHEAMLFFQQASRGVGKSSRRTADKAISAISDKPLPVYFLKDADLKEQMVQGHSNPSAKGRHLHRRRRSANGRWEPKGYLVTHVHKVIDGE